MQCSCGHSPCQCEARFTDLSVTDLHHTLAHELIPVVDEIRDINAQLGIRPYEVSMIKTRWSGGERGVGVEEVVECRKIMPYPKVSTLNALDTVVQAVGEQEMGQIRVTEISARYSENELLGKQADGSDVPADQDFYWEVRLLAMDGRGWRRKFTVSAAPSLIMANGNGSLEWQVTLMRAIADRTREGETRH